MRPAKIDDDELIDRLMDVFRLYGYEGASLSRLVEATGLQRASLYHRFPGGKDEMVKAVLERSDQWIDKHILIPLGSTGTPASRIRGMAKRLDEFYCGGTKSCLLDTLSLGAADTAIRRHVERSFCTWRDALAKVAREAQIPPASARRRAEDALAAIEGALVLARVTGDHRPFQRVLRDLPERLTHPKNRGFAKDTT